MTKMKRMLFVSAWFGLLGSSAFAACPSVPAAVNLKEIEGIVEDLTGSVSVQLSFPNLRERNCEVISEGSIRVDLSDAPGVMRVVSTETGKELQRAKIMQIHVRPSFSEFSNYLNLKFDKALIRAPSIVFFKQDRPMHFSLVYAGGTVAPTIPIARAETW